MSRAFVKEDQTEPGADVVPDRVLSDLPNYVTRRGSALSRQFEQPGGPAERGGDLDEEERRAALVRVDRDLRYTSTLDTAELVDPRGLPPDECISRIRGDGGG